VALVYRSVFTDADGAIASAVPARFVEWLAVKHLSIPEAGLGSQPSALHSEGDVSAWALEQRSNLATGDQLHRLRLIEDQAGDRWTTSVVAIVPAGGPSRRSRARIWVDVEHDPASGSTLKRPGSPRLLRELMAVGEAYDGPVPLTAEAWTVGPTQIDELVSWIASPARSVPLIVFAHDAKRAYDQDRLSRELARDLAGVAMVLRLRDGETTDLFARRLPREYEVWAGAMRTYLPGAGSDADLPSRHRVLGRASLVALGGRAFPAVKDQILAMSVAQQAPVVAENVQRSATSAPSDRGRRRRASDGLLSADWLRTRLRRMFGALGGEGRPTPAPSLEANLQQFDEALETLIERSRTSAADGAQTRALDATAETDRFVSLEAELRTAQEESAALGELVDELQGDLESRLDAVRRLQSDNDELILDSTEAAEEVDRLERQVRFLQTRVRELGESGVGTLETLPDAPPSVADVIELARTHLDKVHIGANVDQVAAELDLDGRAQLFAVKAWASLRALDAYATARGQGEFHGSFHAWCSEPPTGETAIAANAVAMVESETVGNTPDLRNARTFPVPTEVRADGIAYMESHIKIVKRGTPAPRLHFLDDAANTGKVYVGYLGAHLPTARF
jgi:hypothetical protein